MAQQWDISGNLPKGDGQSQGIRYFNFDLQQPSPADADVNETVPLAPAREALAPAKQGWGKAGKCLLNPRAVGAAAQLGPSSLPPPMPQLGTTQRQPREYAAFLVPFQDFLAHRPCLPAQPVLALALIKVTVTV